MIDRGREREREIAIDIYVYIYKDLFFIFKRSKVANNVVQLHAE